MMTSAVQVCWSLLERDGLGWSVSGLGYRFGVWCVKLVKSFVDFWEFIVLRFVLVCFTA